MTTADGKGVFPESHDLSLRVFGIASCQWTYYWMSQDYGKYDGIMVIGSQLGDLSTMKWSPLLCPKGPFIQVDINSEVIGRAYPLTQGIVGEAGAFIRKLVAEIPNCPPDKAAVANRKTLLKEIKEKYAATMSSDDYNSNTNPMHPAAAMRIMQKTLPANSKIFIDAGNCVGWTVHYLTVDAPQEIFTSLSMGPMGFAVGAVVGGKIGCPNDVVVCVTGDGAFMMQGSEVSTAARNKVGAIWIVLYDDDLSMVSQGQAHYFPEEGPRSEWKDMFDFGSPDLKKYSEGLGAKAYDTSSPEELEAALKTAVAESAKGQPQVIIMHIDAKAVPPYYNDLFTPKK
jgi:acetolactate synthase-1/2/3 large subunit